MTIEREKTRNNAVRKKPEILEEDKSSPVELITNGIETSRTEMIPVSRLLLEESIVDDFHVEELKESMKGKRGQLSPITVRVRLEEYGLVVYDIIDGFHRGAALKLIATEKNTDMTALSVVVYGCSDEELFDLRVLAVNSVRSVSFARLSNWMQGSFEKSEWSKKEVTLSQIVSLAATDTSGERLGLTSEEAVRAKRWVIEKSKKWNKPISSLYQDILAVENADPELVKIVRVGSGGRHGKSGVINPARFRAIVEELPKEFELQKKAAEVIIRSDLDKDESRLVAKAVSVHRANEQELEILRNDPRGYIAEPDNAKSGEDDEQDFEEDTHHRSRKFGSMKPHHLGSDSTLVARSTRQKNIETLEKELASLQAVLAKRQEKRESSQNGNPTWYETIPDLTQLERQVMTEFFKNGLDPDTIAEAHGVVTHRVYLILQSAHKKYQIARENQKIKEKMESLILKR